MISHVRAGERDGLAVRAEDHAMARGRLREAQGRQKGVGGGLSPRTLATALYGVLFRFRAPFADQGAVARLGLRLTGYDGKAAHGAPPSVTVTTGPARE